jgi:hypothetical protein
VVEGKQEDNAMTHEQALKKVALAQNGDKDAQREAALWCYRQYLPRLHRLAATTDPAISREDMEMTFFEGCMRGVLVADDRGDPLYHVGQRGIWNVQSELRSIRRQLQRRSLLVSQVMGDDGEPRDSIEDTADPDAALDYERVDDALEAVQRVHVITTVPLKGRERQAVDLIMSATTDVRESGFNRTLARQMGVSPQRASQICSKLRERLQ